MKHPESGVPAVWDRLPDIPLYMDQVVDYLGRQLDGEGPTSSMVHNYVKSGLLPRPDGKRYSREHLARLSAICLLKQVLPVGELDGLMPQGDTAAFYDGLVAMYEEELLKAAEMAPSPGEEPEVAALRLAVTACACRRLCLRLLEKGEGAPGGEKIKKPK
ncbi:MAG TPA: DUF1836 domain-containing protein [Terriglobales bacterium]|nr:DUF1836 domain-containing protein [Terriglobales bacterium]